MEKARAVLFGQWGFDTMGGDMRARQGTTALFWGLTGTGRTRAAEALGFELGKPLKVVDLPHLLSAATSTSTQNTGGTPGGFTKGSRGRRTVQSLFNETRLADAILVLDGFVLQTGEGAGGGGGGGGSQGNVASLDTVLREMGRFPGVVVLMVSCNSPLDVFVHRLNTDLVRALKFLVEFRLPNEKQRRVLWERCVPKKCPVEGPDGLDWRKLADASQEFTVGRIANVVYRAAAQAALAQDGASRCLSMKVLLAALKDEKRKGKGIVHDIVQAQYL